MLDIELRFFAISLACLFKFNKKSLAGAASRAGCLSALNTSFNSSFIGLLDISNNLPASLGSLDAELVRLSIVKDDAFYVGGMNYEILWMEP